MFNFDRFDFLRKNKGITKKFIADSISRHQSICTDWRMQKSEPNDEQIKIIAEILETTPEFLRGQTDDPERKKAPGLSAEDFDLKSYLKTLSNEQLIQFIKLASAELSENLQQHP